MVCTHTHSLTRTHTCTQPRTQTRACMMCAQTHTHAHLHDVRWDGRHRSAVLAQHVGRQHLQARGCGACQWSGVFQQEGDFHHQACQGMRGGSTCRPGDVGCANSGLFGTPPLQAPGAGGDLSLRWPRRQGPQTGRRGTSQGNWGCNTRAWWDGVQGAAGAEHQTERKQEHGGHTRNAISRRGGPKKRRARENAATAAAAAHLVAQVEGLA